MKGDIYTSYLGTLFEIISEPYSINDSLGGTHKRVRYKLLHDRFEHDMGLDMLQSYRKLSPEEEFAIKLQM